MKKRILITGGNGYVGRELTRLLYEKHDVCVVDKLKTGKIRFTPDERKKFRFERVDITEGLATASVIADFAPDTVIHLAAMHYIPECDQFPADAIRTNVVGTVNLLLACPKNTSFVFASSGAVYKPDEALHREEAGELAPSDVYGISKLEGEKFVQHFARERELRAVVVRLFNVVGPGETNPHLMPEIVAQLKAGRTVIRLGNLWPKRDYIHVRDAASGFMAAALNRDVPAGAVLTVNLGTSHPYSVAEILEKLKLVAGIEFKVEADESRARKVDRPFMGADNTEIRRLFDWQPAHDIDDALADLWREPDLTPQLMAKYL